MEELEITNYMPFPIAVNPVVAAKAVDVNGEYDFIDAQILQIYHDATWATVAPFVE